MKERFEGEDGKRRLTDAFLEQRVVVGNAALAAALAEAVELLELDTNDVLIEQEAEDNWVFFVIAAPFVS